MKPDLGVTIAGMQWKNPLTTASGTYAGYENYEQLYDLSAYGAITVKSVSLHPRHGNPPPRLAETPAGLLNAVGIPGPGLDGFLTDEMVKLRKYGVPIVVSIYGKTLSEYVELAERLSDVPDVSALEINMSCPNVGRDTLELGQDPKAAFELVTAIRRVTRLPLIPKLTPNTHAHVPVAQAVAAAGADAISLINTLLAMSLDIRTRLPKTGTLTAGLSGPAIRPIAVRMVWETAEAVDIPIIGMGGIATAEDAIEFLLAGAHAVALGTAQFANPRALEHVLDGISKYLTQNGFQSVREIMGLAHRAWREYHPSVERLHT